MSSKLAILGGVKAVQYAPGDIFTWPIVTKEDEEAVLEVLRRGAMSGTDVTKLFEKEFSDWQGNKYSLAFNTGTAALQSAMYGCGIGIGDEIICPSITYWASVAQVYSLGGTVVFADIDPLTLCIDPNDIEKRITKHTKAIMVVHFLGHPADMDPIMKIAHKFNLKVIEDVSHAQGGLYKGKKLGCIGDVGAMSLMSAKSFAIGEGGILTTNNIEIYERAVAFGHYERFNENFVTDYLKPYAGLPLGGYKYRMHQLSSAMGRVQLKYYDDRCMEIRKAINYFWDLLEGVPGIHPHWTGKDMENTMGGWYAPHGHYCPDELEGLSLTRFVDAVCAEGVIDCYAGCYKPLHTHGLFTTCDVYGHGKPTRIANSAEDIRKFDSSLPISENINALVFGIPWFKHCKTEIIEEYAGAFKKVLGNYKDLLKDDVGNPDDLGNWSASKRH